MLGFAIAACALRLNGFPMAPLLLGFILSPMLEENLRRTLLLSDGTLGVFVGAPLTIALLAACCLVWTVPATRLVNALWAHKASDRPG